MKIEIDERQLAAILAALRVLGCHGIPGGDILDIATNGGEFEPLNLEEIDSLCEHLNLGSSE